MFLQKLKLEVAYDLAISPLGRSPSQHTTKIPFASCLSVLFGIAMEWGRCPSTGEWVEKTGVYNQCGNSA